MLTSALRPTPSLTLISNFNLGRRRTCCRSQMYHQRISSTARSDVVAKKPPSDGLSSPLPAPSLSTSKYPINPVKAKQRYLESKQRTEEFLKDPQKKMNQLQAEINQVKERLDKQVYNKSVWQRLTDPLKRKQHSLINMIAAVFAYILAFQLHLKRQANQKLTEEINAQENKVQNLKDLLRSLLDDDYLQDMATAVASEKVFMMTGSNRKESPWYYWGSFKATAATERDSLSHAQMDAMVQILRSKLEKRIGDDGLDEHAKKERDIERIWKENKQKIESNQEPHVAGLLFLAKEDEKQHERDSSITKQRTFDM
jgi:flagellar biosynthesis regulator FlaF